ncbi:MAG: type II toxin-antitoxin system RelE/ParE family toxin [Proteobacteria bacterium]|nr:type II toxin-antitoxin system RelE/ParE family toxin [Pseudomonadota bacterium]
MTWTILLSDKVKKQLSKLDQQSKSDILNFLYQDKLHQSPKSSGKNLRGNLKKFWRYRVGDYRIICEMKNSELVVLVIDVGHRNKVYKTK